MSATNLGFNVIFFLDADNWFEKDHVESILKMKTEMPFLDISASYRNFFFQRESLWNQMLLITKKGISIQVVCAFLRPVFSYFHFG